MKKKQRIITASVTVLAAIATAHLMQRGSGDVPGIAGVAPAQAGIVSTAVNLEPVSETARAPNTVTVVAKPQPTLQQAATGTTGDTSEVQLIAAVAATDPVQTRAVTKFPEMPRPPLDALMPTPLPILGPELQSRMAPVVAQQAKLDEAVEPTPNAVSPPKEILEPEVARNEFGLSCGAFLSATVKDAAMVGLTLTDPCRGNEVFTLSHGTLIFTGKLSQLGTHKVDVPALGTDAVFSVRFQDGGNVETKVSVPTADLIDRVALFTKDRSGLEIHALEFGADYDQKGHVWVGNARDAQAATKTGGGFVTALGDSSIPNAQLAQVYTFPANTRNQKGVVRLSIETEVTALNCGKDIAGETLQINAGKMSAPVSLTLAMPGCDAIGEFLVLKNLLRDLKIASN